MLNDRKTRAALRFARVVLDGVVGYETYPYSIHKHLTKKDASKVIYQLLKQSTKKNMKAYKDMLKHLEWSHRNLFECCDGDYEHFCPICGGHITTGHFPDCELARLLGE